MIPDELKKMFKLNTKEDVNMANNIWKMLDEMSDNSPEQYKEFIQSNMKQGIKEVKAEKEQKEKPFLFKPNKCILIEFDAELNQKNINLPAGESTTTTTTASLEEKLNLNKEKWPEIYKTFSPKVYILLNICMSDRVKLPETKSKNPLKPPFLNNLKEMEIFYYSLQQYVEASQKSSSSSTSSSSTTSPEKYDFCMILNETFVLELIRSPEGQKMLFGLCLSHFEERIQKDLNPLLKRYSPHQYGLKLAFYEVVKPSIKVFPQKYSYGGKETVQEVLLEPEVDTMRIKELKEKEEMLMQKKNQAKQGRGEESISSHEPKQELKEIKFKKEEKPEEEPMEEKTTSNTTESINKKNKFIVEVLKEESSSEAADNTSSNKLSYEMKESETLLEFSFLIPNIESINDIDLNISKDTIRVKRIKDDKYTEINLKNEGKQINTEDVSAKYKKKSKLLNLKLKKCE